MKYYCLTLLTAFFWLLPANAQKEGKIYPVSGTFTIEVPPYMSLNQARQDAIIKAQNQAIENAFGSTVSSKVTTIAYNRDGKSGISTHAINEGMVRGVWLGNTSEPEISDLIQKDGKQWLEVSIKGRARKLTNAGVEFEAEAIRYKPDRELKTEEFKNGDDFFLYFKSPADGYLNVFMFDIASNTVVCLLPYQDSGSGSYPILHNEDYYFFSPEKAKSEDGAVSEVVMTCSESNQEEFNELYVVFSPEYFAKGNAKIQQKQISEELVVPPAMEYLDFNKWLLKNQEKDEKMQVLRMSLHVTNR